MNKTRKIISIMVIILISFNYIFSIKAVQQNLGTTGIGVLSVNKTKLELEDLRTKIKDLISKVGQLDVQLNGQLKQDLLMLDEYIKSADNKKLAIISIPKINFDNITTHISLGEEKLKKLPVITNNTTQTNTQISSDFDNTYYVPKTIQKVNNGVYIANASTSQGHKELGDQSGDEVLIEAKTGDKRLYKVYRASDTKLQRTIAFIAADLSNNDNIGYNYGGSNLMSYSRNHNYNPEEIVEKCEADCSSFVSAAIEAGLAKSGQNIKVSRMTTGGMSSELPQYGYNVVSDLGTQTISEFYQTGKLQIGDVLVTARSGHTVIFVGPYYTIGKIAPSNGGAYGQTTGGYTAQNEEIDDRENLDDNKFRFQGMPGEVTYEGEVSIIRNFFKKIGDFIDYLLGLIFMIIKVVIIGFTNIVYNIFLTIVSYMKK